MLPIPPELWAAAPKDVTWWAVVLPVEELDPDDYDPLDWVYDDDEEN